MESPKSIGALLGNDQSVELDLKFWAPHVLGAVIGGSIETNLEKEMHIKRRFLWIKDVVPGEQFEKILGKNACKDGFIILKGNEAVVIESMDDVARLRKHVGEQEFRLT